MIRPLLFKVMLGVGFIQGSCFVSGCSSDSAHEEGVEAAGTFSLPLLAHAGAHTYRLQGGLYVNGPVFTYLDINADVDVLTTSLPTGNYYAQLYYWTLTRDDGTGTFLPVSATLVSSSALPFSIFNQATTTVSFEFETDGQLVTVGAGALNLAIAVNETPAVCAPLGSDCPAGTWCAPSELTGASLGCIPEGPLALGMACSSPLDCAANSSCFDFGGGSACTALCASAEFDLPCGSGGTCTPQGVDYGVCVP